MIKGSAMDLGRLPPEIVIEVVRNVGSLRSLYHLTLASADVYRIFQNAGGGILDALLEDSVSYQVERLIRIVAVLRTCESDRPPSPTFEEFCEVYLSGDEAPGFLQTDVQSLAKIYLNYPSLSPGSPRDILVIAKRIALLTEAGASFFRLCLSRVTPPPSAREREIQTYIEEQGSRSTNGDSGTFEAGAIQWDEEQRIARALWRIQVMHELQTAGEQGRLGWSSTETMKRELASPSLLFQTWIDEEVEMDFVLNHLHHGRQSRALGKPKTGHEGRWWLPDPEDYADEKDWPLINSRNDKTDCCSIPCSGSWHLRSMGVAARIMRILIQMESTPARGLPLKTWKHFALLFMSRKTLMDMHLLPYVQGQGEQPGDLIATWRGVLNPEVVGMIEDEVYHQANVVRRALS